MSRKDKKIVNDLVFKTFQTLGKIVDPNEIDNYVDIIGCLLKSDVKTATAFKALVDKLEEKDDLLKKLEFNALVNAKKEEVSKWEKEVITTLRSF